MPDFYAGLDLYWQPSFSEPWGLVVNEAMASGLPVLVSDRCGCARDLVKTGNGWIHDLSESSMQASLEAALSRSQDWPRMGAASREVINDWDVDRFAQGLMQACHLSQS